LARIVERITTKFGGKRLTGAVFLDVAKTYGIVWIGDLLDKLKLLNFRAYKVHIISSCPRGRAFEGSFQTATSSLRGMRLRVAPGGLFFPILLILFVNDMPHPRTTSSKPSTRKTRSS
jgi:hypothetical protein